MPRVRPPGAADAAAASLGLKHGALYPHAFDPFDACVDAVRTGRVDVGGGAPLWCLAGCPPACHAPGACATVAALVSPLEHAVYLAAAYRAAAAEAIEAAAGDDECERYDARVFADAHLPILRAACDSGRADDDELRAMGADAPRADEVECEETLPDVVHAVGMANFWYETRPRGVALAHLFSKALPQRCQFRNLREIVKGYCDSDPALFRFVARLVHCSLAGGYRRARSAPRLARRLELSVGMLEAARDAASFQWLWEHPYVLFYSLKEYVVLAVSLEPALAEVVGRSYQWDAFQAYASAGMDVARAAFDRSGDLDAAERDLARMNYRQTKYLYKLRKGSCAHALLAEFERSLPGGVPPPPAAALRVGDGDRMTREEVEALHGPVLRVLGASDAAVEALCRAADAAAADAAGAVARAFCDIPAGDLALVASYVRGVHEQSQIRAFPLPEHAAAAQRAALRARLGLRPGDPLPAEAGVYYACRSCRALKAFLVAPNATCPNLYASGHSKVVYEASTGALYCGRKREDPGCACMDTPLVRVPLLGRIARVYGRSYALCGRCASPAEHAFWKNTPRGFECGRCAAEDERLVRRFEDDAVRCEICRAPRPARRVWTCIPVYDDVAVPNGARRAYLCERHAKRVARRPHDGVELLSALLAGAGVPRPPPQG